MRVADLGRVATRQRLFESFYAEVGLQRDRYPPGQDEASVNQSSTAASEMNPRAIGM